MLSKTKRENKQVYIMGDFNINLLNSEKHNLTSEFLQLMYSNSYLPLINKPTRVTATTATLIDNIFEMKLMDKTSPGDSAYWDIWPFSYILY